MIIIRLKKVNHVTLLFRNRLGKYLHLVLGCSVMITVMKQHAALQNYWFVSQVLLAASFHDQQQAVLQSKTQV